MITLHVTGTPAPKGSARAIKRGGFAVLVASSSNANRDAQAAWVRAVRDAIAPNIVPIIGPVWVCITFRMPRPRGHYGKGKRGTRLLPSAPALPTVRPDVDKTLRCTLDALTGLAFADDSSVVSISVTKLYAQHGVGSGAEIRIAPYADQQEKAQEAA